MGLFRKLFQGKPQETPEQVARQVRMNELFLSLARISHHVRDQLNGQSAPFSLNFDHPAVMSLNASGVICDGYDEKVVGESSRFRLDLIGEISGNTGKMVSLLMNVPVRTRAGKFPAYENRDSGALRTNQIAVAVRPSNTIQRIDGAFHISRTGNDVASEVLIDLRSGAVVQSSRDIVMPTISIQSTLQWLRDGLTDIARKKDPSFDRQKIADQENMLRDVLDSNIDMYINRTEQAITEIMGHLFPQEKRDGSAPASMFAQQ